MTLCFAAACVIAWAWLSPYSLAQDAKEELSSFGQIEASDVEPDAGPDEAARAMTEQRSIRSPFREKWEPFVRHGTRGEKKAEIKADDILKAIAAGRDIDIEHAVIDGDMDIEKLAGRLGRDESGNPIIPVNIWIRSSEIRGSTLFGSATFKGNTAFNSTTFVRNVEFVGATFNEYANFNSATFSRGAEFTDATLNGNAEFIGTTFSGDVSFKSTRFNGYVYFRSATFGTSVDFTDATMNGATDFIEATFTVEARFHRTSMARPASFEGVRFRENTVTAGLWNNVASRIIRFLPKKVVTDFLQFDTGSIMDGSSNPFLKRYIDDEQWIESWRQSIWWREAVFILWEITSHCGRSIGLWAFWSAVIALVFGIIYSRLLSDSIAFSVERLRGEKPGFWGCLYYSVVTLTTLGFGDIVPLTNRARLAVGIEVGLGYIMLGGLVSIFANKMASRS